MLEIDGASSFGTLDIRLSDMFTNAAEVVWNGKTGASLFFRCNCTSTAFAPNKHGGEKGIHMRFQVDTYELVATTTTKSHQYHSSSSFNNSTNNNTNYYHQSNLSPSNSSLLSSSSSSSSSSFLSNELKLSKDDFDCVTPGAGASSSSDFSKNNQQKQQQDTKDQDSFRSPSPIIDFSTGNYWKHACSSYCRIQLFRLKGAQRKLKTDRSKVERLNPPDLRKRYQPSSKVTILCNNHFDQLYSLMPFNRYLNNSNNINNNNNRTPDSTIDIGNLIENRHASMDFSGINTSTFYLNNNLTSSLLPLYNDNQNSLNLNGNNNNYSLQPIQVVQQQQQPQLVHKLKTELNSSILLSTNDSLKLMPSSSSSSSSSVSSNISNDDANYFLDSNNNNNSYSYENNGHHNQNKLVMLNHNSEISTQQMSVMINTEDNNLNQTYAVSNNDDGLVYTRLKRASSISSLNSNASYGSSNNNCLNYNYKNNNKFQKTNNNNSSAIIQQQQQQKFIANSSSPSFMQHQSTSPLLASMMSTSQPQLYHQPQSPTKHTPISSSYVQLQSSLVDQSANKLNNVSFNSVISLDTNNNNSLTSVASSNSNNNSSIFRSKTLPNDCGHKFVQDWLVVNRFSHLLHLFANYTSNDILRLSKEDMIALCGAPDGIRCFNMAHNILIKPKLTIFVTFQNQTFFSAIFLADWKSKYLIKKLLSLYNSFVTNTTNADDDDDDNETNNNKSNETTDSNNEQNENNDEDDVKNEKLETNSEATKEYSIKNLTEHQKLSEQMHNSKLEYELFLKIKDILVQTTDEVLNNLNDQSRFLVKFEMPTPNSVSNNNNNSNDLENKNNGLNNLIKILLIPLD